MDAQHSKKNDQRFNLMFLLFHFLHSNDPDNKCHKQKWRVLFFPRIRLVTRVLACARAIARVKWIRLRVKKQAMKLTVVKGNLACQVQSKGFPFLAASRKSFSPRSLIKLCFLATNVVPFCKKNKKQVSFSRA